MTKMVMNGIGAAFCVASIIAIDIAFFIKEDGCWKGFDSQNMQ